MCSTPQWTFSEKLISVWKKSSVTQWYRYSSVDYLLLICLWPFRMRWQKKRGKMEKVCPNDQLPALLKDGMSLLFIFHPLFGSRYLQVGIWYKEMTLTQLSCRFPQPQPRGPCVQEGHQHDNQQQDDLSAPEKQKTPVRSVNSIIYLFYYYFLFCFLKNAADNLMGGPLYTEEWNQQLVYSLMSNPTAFVNRAVHRPRFWVDITCADLRFRLIYRRSSHLPRRRTRSSCFVIDQNPNSPTVYVNLKRTFLVMYLLIDVRKLCTVAENGMVLNS